MVNSRLRLGTWWMGIRVLLIGGGMLLTGSVLAAGDATGDVGELNAALAEIRLVGHEGVGHVNAQRAWQTLSQADVAALPVLLAGMPSDNPLAANWIRAAVDSVAQRAQQQGQQLPVAALESYLADREQTPRSRRLAFEWLVAADPPARGRWLPQLLNDPSLELRRDAVELELDAARRAEAAGDMPGARDHFHVALAAARDLDQIQSATESLRRIGETVSLPELFGFLMNWHLIGPFDNVNQAGFDRAFPPEEQIDLAAHYVGKEGEIQWKSVVTSDEYGAVDLNAELGKHKGATAYAFTTFQATEPRLVELRLGCINANKIWLNGALLTANHVYHAGDGIDQYVGRGQLVAGENTILVKICQNEQTEEWAQDWKFQLRVCDQVGTAVLAADRAPAK